MGHARALVGVSDIALQLSLYRDTLEKNLTVRLLEDLIRSYTQPKEKTEDKPKIALSADHKKVQNDLSHHFGSKVVLKRDDSGKGSIVINFTDDGDLNRILDAMSI